MNTKKEYDVALSFAGEDRNYVKKVAESLKCAGIHVFYDDFEESNLWGKDLYTHLQDVYKNRAKYTIIFASQHYANKSWTKHERESAQERAFSENSEYILLARFDDTQIPGIKDTVAYVDLRRNTPSEFCELILNKLKENPSGPISATDLLKKRARFNFYGLEKTLAFFKDSRLKIYKNGKLVHYNIERSEGTGEPKSVYLYSSPGDVRLRVEIITHHHELLEQGVVDYDYSGVSNTIHIEATQKEYSLLVTKAPKPVWNLLVGIMIEPADYKLELRQIK